MGGVSAWQSGRFADDAQTDVAALVEEDISRTATGVYDVVSTQGASTARWTPTSPPHYVLGQAGGFSIDRNPRSPQGRLGGEEPALGRGDRAVAAPRPDRRPVAGQERRRRRAHAGGRHDQGDGRGDGHDLPEDARRRLPRVATNVQAASGARAIGTYIPVTNPDGAANPVVETVMRGETYRGNAFVVDSWLVSAYAP